VLAVSRSTAVAAARRNPLICRKIASGSLLATLAIDEGATPALQTALQAVALENGFSVNGAKACDRRASRDLLIVAARTGRRSATGMA